MAAERLQKILAAAGYGSRRACEELIAAGRVRVNGHTATLGDKADPQADTILVDGEAVQAESKVYVMLNKPRFVVSSLEAQGERDTVADLVPVPERLYPVGRLDALSEGLVLLTNDGELTNRLTHPRYGHEKEYRVLIRGRIDLGRLEVWRRGVVLRDETGKSERTAPAQVEIEGRDRQGAGTWLHVVMREGKKHQIRRVAETLGLRVTRLVRIRIGTLHMSNVRAGEWRYLTRTETRELLAGAGLKPEKRKSAPAAHKGRQSRKQSGRPQQKSPARKGKGGPRSGKPERGPSKPSRGPRRK